MKDVRSQRGGVVQCGHFADKGDSSNADVRIFWRKNFGFFEIYDVSARTRGVGGQFFAILCGRPLWTALYVFDIFLLIVLLFENSKQKYLQKCFISIILVG